MGAFTIDFNSVVLPNLMAAISDALEKEVADAAIDIIAKSAKERVYDAYTPKSYVRRGSLENANRDNTYSWNVLGNTLEITAHPTFSGGKANGDLGDVIASGNANYNMPFPRPWMDEGISANMDKIEAALYAGLTRQGF